VLCWSPLWCAFCPTSARGAWSLHRCADGDVTCVSLMRYASRTTTCAQLYSCKARCEWL
jgi:hypothetical protein